MKKIEMIVERTKTGYSAYAKNYPVATTGKDLIELKANIVEAMNLYFEESGQSVSECDCGSLSIF
jgi:predicted RNase H-like HicB family nuclease